MKIKKGQRWLGKNLNEEFIFEIIDNQEYVDLIKGKIIQIIKVYKNSSYREINKICQFSSYKFDGEFDSASICITKFMYLEGQDNPNGN